MREEWRSVFPTHRMKGCSFHFNKVNLLKNVTNCKYQDQALLKRVCDDGKLTLYNSPSLTGKAFKGIIWMGFSLPFVPIAR